MQSRGSQQDGQLALQPPLQLPTLLSRGAARAASEAGGGASLCYMLHSAEEK